MACELVVGAQGASARFVQNSYNIRKTSRRLVNASHALTVPFGRNIASTLQWIPSIASGMKASGTSRSICTKRSFLPTLREHFYQHYQLCQQSSRSGNGSNHSNRAAGTVRLAYRAAHRSEHTV